MKSTQQKNSYTLVLEKGENIIKTLKKFLSQKDIKAAHFSAIGAISEVDLGFYNLDIKQYTTKKFLEPLEIASMTGNVSELDGEIIIHCHGVFSKKDFSTIGGHVNESTVAATCEVFINQLDGKLHRKHDPKIGLNLLDL